MLGSIGANRCRRRHRHLVWISGQQPSTRPPQRARTIRRSARSDLLAVSTRLPSPTLVAQAPRHVSRTAVSSALALSAAVPRLPRWSVAGETDDPCVGCSIARAAEASPVELRDFVSLSELIGRVQRERSDLDERGARLATLELLRYALARNEAEVGNFSPGKKDLVVWGEPCEEAVRRVALEWDRLGRQPLPGEVAWLQVPRSR